MSLLYYIRGCAPVLHRRLDVVLWPCTMLFSWYCCFGKTSLMEPSIVNPSIRRRNCSVVSSRASSGVRGHWKRLPAYSLFTSISIPSPSNKMLLYGPHGSRRKGRACLFLSRSDRNSGGYKL